jgi:hypothetical protein
MHYVQVSAKASLAAFQSSYVSCMSPEKNVSEIIEQSNRRAAQHLRVAMILLAEGQAHTSI